MKKNLLILLLPLIFISVETLAGTKNQDSILILKNGYFLNVLKGKFSNKQALVIKNGQISHMGKMPKAAKNAKVIDLNGAYVIPGLIDAHAHVTAKYKNQMEKTLSHLNYFLQHGITTVRDAGGDGAALLQAQNAIRAGKVQGADVFFSSFIAGDWYYNRGQHLRTEPYTPWEQRLVPGDDLDAAMAKARACGATGVKLYHSFDSDFLLNVVKAAKKQGLKVWGHTMLYPAKPIEVVQSGVEVLSHVYMLETLRTDSLFNLRKTSLAYKDSIIKNINIIPFCREMKKRNAILDATLCVSEERDPWVFALLRRVHAQGVKIAAGTDQIVDITKPYPRLIDELSYFVNKCGFTPAQAIFSATMISAEVIGEQKNRGSIQRGKRADLVVLKQNPLTDINSLRILNMVIQNGKIKETYK